MYVRLDVDVDDETRVCLCWKEVGVWANVNFWLYLMMFLTLSTISLDERSIGWASKNNLALLSFGALSLSISARKKVATCSVSVFVKKLAFFLGRFFLVRLLLRCRPPGARRGRS